MDDLVENVSDYPESVLRKHLYRIQKLSTKYYEFRLANKYMSHHLWKNQNTLELTILGIVKQVGKPTTR